MLNHSVAYKGKYNRSHGLRNVFLLAGDDEFDFYREFRSVKWKRIIINTIYVRILRRRLRFDRVFVITSRDRRNRYRPASSAAVRRVCNALFRFPTHAFSE